MKTEKTGDLKVNSKKKECYSLTGKSRAIE